MEVTNFFPFFLTSDIDECSAESIPCDENAECINSDGSYSCTCKKGFTGNGSACEGMLENSLVYKSDWSSHNTAHGLFLFAFPLLKMLMSVLRNPFRAMKTLTAPTLAVLTAVLVNKGSLEMGYFVKVPRVFIDKLTNRCTFTTVIPSTTEEIQKNVICYITPSYTKMTGKLIVVPLPIFHSIRYRWVFCGLQSLWWKH